MASIKRIKPGQTLYNYQRVKAGNTTMTREAEYKVQVYEVDLDKNQILCSWNGNQKKWVTERTFKNYRVKRKEKVKSNLF